MPDFNSEVKSVTQELDSIALSLSQHSITVRVSGVNVPAQTVLGKTMSTEEANRDAASGTILNKPGLAGRNVAYPNQTEPSLVEFSSQITALSTRLKNALAAATALTVAPTITSVSPPSGPAGTVITITGTGFGNSPDGAIVHIAGIPAHPNSWSETKILATVPAFVSKGDVSVTTTGGKSADSFAFESDYVPPVPAETEAPVTRAIPGPPFSDPEPIIDAPVGTSEFAAQSIRHRAWEERQKKVEAEPEPLITAPIGTPEYAAQKSCHDAWVKLQQDKALPITPAA